MIGLNHVLTGAAIGIAIKEPLLVAPFAFLSHFILDSLPHFGGMAFYEFGHRHFAKVMWLDGLLSVGALSLVIAFAPEFAPGILLGAFFAILPDAILLDYYLKKRHGFWFHTFHLGIQWFERPPGALVETSYLFFISTVVVVLMRLG